MAMKFVLTLTLCLLSLTGTIFAITTDVRFTLPMAAQAGGVTLAPGEYVLRQMDSRSGALAFLIYSSDGKDHKATLPVRVEPGTLNGPVDIEFGRVNGALELSAVHAAGQVYRVVR